MWRWVTRGLVLSLLALLAPALFAQDFIGDVDLPDPAQTHSGVVLVRGWALDRHEISRIELWVDDQYQHNAQMFLPRVDVTQGHPDWPNIDSARPGFTTAFLASRFTNGPHTVEIRVHTSNGQVHFLGRRTININNSINQAPFGSLDVPSGPGVANVSGAFPVLGWALDADGIERVQVLVDDGVVQDAMYGDPRPDVAAAIPDFPAAMFSAYVATIDTTKIQNGVHTIAVRAIDRKGLARTIGRRTVQVINNGIFLRPFGFLDEPLRDAVLYGTSCGIDDEPVVVSPPIRFVEHITPVRGWALDLGTRPGVGRVQYVELLVDGVRWLSSDDCGVVGGSFANCYGIPRYDVARYYPTFPDAPRAGFLFTLDVGALMRLGVRPGHHRLSVRVGDVEQTFAELPNSDGIPVWFQCVDNTFPFAGNGFIEFPEPFDYVAGTVTFRGWALQSMRSIVAVEVIVDGNYVGQAQYGFPRPDVADQYPFVIGARNSGWQFTMDTRLLGNSQHRLTVRVVDSSGNRSEIGSRDFYVFNPQ